MQVTIQSIINESFNSNTYLIKSITTNTDCYLIDIGNADDTINILEGNQHIKGIFLTHPHYDHICGINKIIAEFPNCTIFCSKYTKDALRDSKINLSFYQQSPITYKRNNIKIISETSVINLFHNTNLETFETPGHNEGSLTFKIGNAIFTGDSLIPNIPVVTKLKTGNKAKAYRSISKIRDNTNYKDVIYPGHGKSMKASEINWEFYIQK